MKNTVVDFTAQEVDVLIRHLKGLCALYTQVNESGSGPLSAVLWKIQKAANAPAEGRD